MTGKDILIWILEIAYTIIWSVSFYFQVYTTYKSKRGDGYSLDFQFLNIIGFAYYSGYNIYDYLHNNTEAEGIMDMVFSIHALLISIVLVIQTYYYPRKVNKISWSAVGTIVVVLVSFGVYMLLNETASNF
jgi:cystinosin